MHVSNQTPHITNNTGNMTKYYMFAYFSYRILPPIYLRKQLQLISANILPKQELDAVETYYAYICKQAQKMMENTLKISITKNQSHYK
jgi:hypothetical protein